MLSADRLLTVLWERKWTFLATFLVTLGAAAFVTSRLEKVYKTTAYLYVTTGTGQTPTTFDQVQASQVVIKTLAELLQTRKVAQATADRLPYEISAASLLGQVEVAGIQQSQLITITVSSSSAERARLTANTYGGTFVSLQRELLAEGANQSKVRLAASAPLVEDPARPKPRLYLLVGAFVALLAAAGAALLRDRTDKRLRLDSSTTELEGVPIIGQIPRVPASSISAPVMGGVRPPTARQLDESYRLVLANLTFANEGIRPKSLAVVSSGRSEGKSTASLSLALGAAELDIDVLLVDGDMRRPRVGSLVGPADERDPNEGLSSVLRGEVSAASATAEVVDDTSLSLLRSGPLPPNPAGLLAGRQLTEFVQQTSKGFDLVIIDTPPLTVGADASLIASVTQGVVLVIDARSTSRTDVHRAVDQLRRARANLLGIVLNRIDAPQAEGYYAPDPPARRRWTPGAARERDREATPAAVAPDDASS